MNAEFLKERLTAAGINVADGCAETLAEFAEFLLAENEKYNLTAVTDDGEVAVKHFADSLFALPLIDDGANVADIGSGAGIPAIPLSVARKDLTVTAVESIGKKAEFIRTASRKLNIGNLNVENKRIEDYGHGAGRGAYDFVTARAVAPLATLLEYAVPLLKKGGRFLAYKGKRAEEEIESAKAAAKVFHAKIEKVSRYVLENGEERVIIVYVKEADTPAQYPRGQNKPRKSPVGGVTNGEKIR